MVKGNKVKISLFYIWFFLFSITVSFCISFQYNIYVEDEGTNTQLRSDVQVQVNILRDSGTLVFRESPYSGEIVESVQLGYTILTAKTSPAVSLLEYIDNLCINFMRTDQDGSILKLSCFFA